MGISNEKLNKYTNGQTGLYETNYISGGYNKNNEIIYREEILTEWSEYEDGDIDN